MGSHDGRTAGGYFSVLTEGHHFEELPEKAEVESDAQKALTKGQKLGEVQHTIRSQVMQL